jgi:anti-sigma factor RsiW
MRCEQVRHRILEQTLERAFDATGPLVEHLQSCCFCRAFLAHVTEVDLALRALPVQCAPVQVTHRILAQASRAGRERELFLPWTLWVPVASLLVGIFWVYMTLVWPSAPGLVTSLDPTVATWLTGFEQWVAAQQATLNAVAISVGAGLVFTLLAIVLGLYVGRNRAAVRHGHSL